VTDEINANTPLVCSDERHAAKVADLERQLAALRQVARGYCPACGRGDAAPTVADWETQKQRADEAEAQQRLTDAMRQQNLDAAAAAIQRAEQAEAAIARVRTLAVQSRDHSAAGLDDYQIGRHDLAVDILTALDEPTPAPAGTEETEHVYLSTGCIHGDHTYCKNMTGLNGAKRPGECKHCGTKCICGCHNTEEQP
jgi:hypothetical protein